MCCVSLFSPLSVTSKWTERKQTQNKTKPHLVFGKCWLFLHLLPKFLVTGLCPAELFNCGNGACFRREAGCDTEINCGNEADKEPCPGMKSTLSDICFFLNACCYLLINAIWGRFFFWGGRVFLGGGCSWGRVFLGEVFFGGEGFLGERFFHLFLSKTMMVMCSLVIAKPHIRTRCKVWKCLKAVLSK